MSFHPRMYASVHGFQPLHRLRSLDLGQMAVDYWHVQCETQAGGRYVSMHPRFVLLLDGRKLSLARNRHDIPRPCAAAYIPAGLELWGQTNRPGPLRHLDIHLPLKRLKELTGHGIPLDRPVFLPDLEGLDALAQVLIGECRAPSRAPHHAAMLAQALILEMLHRSPPVAGPATNNGTARPGTWLTILRAHVFENMDRRIPVERLAELAGMSRTHFNRIFRHETGLSPYQWVMDIRIGHAKALLRKGVPFVEVASITGFADQAHFNRAFKAATGLAPGLWIKEHTGAAPDPNLQDNRS